MVLLFRGFNSEGLCALSVLHQCDGSMLATVLGALQGSGLNRPTLVGVKVDSGRKRGIM